MSWALVFMLCTNRYECTPQYVEGYATRKECVQHIPKEKTTTMYALCAPVSKD